MIISPLKVAPQTRNYPGRRRDVMTKKLAKNGGLKPSETGKKGDDLPLTANAHFLIDALELVAGRVDADSKADRRRFERLPRTGTVRRAAPLPGEPESLREHASVHREAGVEINKGDEFRASPYS